MKYLLYEIKWKINTEIDKDGIEYPVNDLPIVIVLNLNDENDDIKQKLFMKYKTDVQEFKIKEIFDI